MRAKQYVIGAPGDLYLGDPADGHDGDWIIQVVAIAGTTPTLTPKATLQPPDPATGLATGTVARKFSPIDGSADVASASAAGIWTVKGPAPLVLTLAGAGATCTLLAYPVVR